jgi:gluconolactonase
MRYRTTSGCLALLALLQVPWQPAVADASTQPAIAGVLAAGTPVELVKEDFEAVEGPLPLADGSLLFTNNRAAQVLRAAPDGTVSTWLDASGGANALAATASGEIVATQVGELAIAVLAPGKPARVLARGFEGKPFNRPNDLVASRSGSIYFTDTAAVNASNPPLPSALYRLTPDGDVLRLATDIARPNGVALSPDERTLYVANTTGEWILAFTLDRSGGVKDRREFARLAMPAARDGAPASAGADGLAVDRKGRLFVATALGVQAFSARGEPLGIIALPKQPQNLAFAGAKRSTLYVVGRGAVYRIATLTSGPRRAGK